MPRGLKLGIGIPLTLIGLFMTIGGIAVMVWVGPDGSFTLPDQRAIGDGNALVFDEIDIDRSLPASGNVATTLDLQVRGNTDKEVFIGVGPAAQVDRYLARVPVDRIVQVNWPGGVKTEAVPGVRQPDGPPMLQSFWTAKAQGSTASIRWTLERGAWTVVIMNADASAAVDVTGTAAVTLPLLGPIGVAVLVIGLIALVAGILLTISGAKTPRTVPAGPPSVPAEGGAQPPPGPSGGAPPRPDAG
ncbi:MAG TPA: hypothetical protein VK646_10530 [Actinomycetota bacterium]|nr:hypothetical protein [Actinomycetota bacterium]